MSKRIIELPDKVVEAIQNGEDYRYDIHTAIAQSKPYDDWISVKERLPEDFCLYAVTSEEKDGKHIYNFYFNPISKNFICAYPECITAWRPLPETYKESEDN